MWKFLLAAAFAAASSWGLAADANQASAAELQAIKGIGPAMAGRIVQARETAPFQDWEDLIDRVRGIAPLLAARFSEEGLRVNQQAFPASSAEPAAPAGGPKAGAAAQKPGQPAPTPAAPKPAAPNPATPKPTAP